MPTGRPAFSVRPVVSSRLQDRNLLVGSRPGETTAPTQAPYSISVKTMVQKNDGSTESFGRTGKVLSLRRSTHACTTNSAGSADAGGFASSSRGSTRKRTLVARREAQAHFSDTSSDDGDGARPVASGWLVRLHQMLTLDKDEIIEYDDGRLVIRDPDLLASEVRPRAAAPSPLNALEERVHGVYSLRSAQDMCAYGVPMSAR